MSASCGVYTSVRITMQQTSLVSSPKPHAGKYRGQDVLCTITVLYRFFICYIISVASWRTSAGLNMKSLLTLAPSTELPMPDTGKGKERPLPLLLTQVIAPQWP